MNRRVLVSLADDVSRTLNTSFARSLGYTFKPLQGWLPPLVQSLNFTLTQSPSRL